MARLSMINAVGPGPGERDVHVWWASPGEARASHLGLLDSGERDRYAAYLRDADKDRFLAGCALIRLTIAAYLDTDAAALPVHRSCDRCDRPHGRPRVPGGLEISLSHSGDRVVLAVARNTPVGVDVEAVPTLSTMDVDGLAERVLTGAERAALAGDGADRLTGFLRLWTRKEAVVKATGDGLRTELSSFEVSAPDAPARVVRAPDGRTFQLFDLPGAGPGHVGALAVIGPPGRRVRELTAVLG